MAVVTVVTEADATELRRADVGERMRLGRLLLGAQAEFLERTYLTPAEVARVLADLAEAWARDTARRVTGGLAAGWDPG